MFTDGRTGRQTDGRSPSCNFNYTPPIPSYLELNLATDQVDHNFTRPLSLIDTLPVNT